MSGSSETRTRFEHADPILSVASMSASLRGYVEVLGFTNAEWGDDAFTAAIRDGAWIYLCQGGQGQPGTWVWVGVEDVEALYREYEIRGARIRQSPTDHPWACEMTVEDPDGHVLRFGSAPRTDIPFA